MIGRIRSLSAGSASGFIQAEDGLTVYFDISAVLAYDVTGLAPGQVVTFDLESGSRSRAVNVCVQGQHKLSPAREKHPETIQLRYMGFEQRNNLRAYRFDRISTRAQAIRFTVTTDLSLFTKHHVGIQNGPALCLHVLTADLESALNGQRPDFDHLLTDQDMLAYVASRPAPKPKHRPKWTPRPHESTRTAS